MPVIPSYKRQVSIPGESGNVMQDVAGAGVVGSAVANLGKNAADIIFKHGEKLKAQDNVDVAEKAGVDISGTLRAAEDDYKTQGNKFSTFGELSAFSDDYNKKLFDALKEKHVSGVTDTDRRQLIEKHLGSKWESFLDFSAVFQADMKKKFITSGIEKITGDAVEGAQRGEDLDTALQAFQDSIGEYHKVGSISEPDAVEKIVKGRQQIATAWMDNLVARDPDRAMKIIDAGEYNRYLPEKQVRYFYGQAKQIKAQKEVEQRRIDKEQKITGATTELTTTFGLDKDAPDWAGAIKELYKPENLSRWGITFQESQQIFSGLHARSEFDQRSEKLLKKQEEDGVKKTAYDFVNKGKFKEAFDLLDKSKLDRKDVYDFKQKIVTDQRQEANYQKQLGKDSAESTQKKAEKWILNNVKGDQVGYAIQTYRAGLVQNNLGPDRFDEYARQVAALPRYSKKTLASGRLAAALGLPTGGQQPNQALKPIPLNVVKQIKSQVKTKKAAEDMARKMGYDPNTMEVAQ